jgi:uncharacterized protein YjbJ (UPF0337 family)
MTFLAVMDEAGFAQFASVANVAHRARVSLDEAKEAVGNLEAPDENSSDPEFEGRRIERVQGGWMVLNAGKYKDLVTRAEMQRLNRIRVQRFREKKKNGNGSVMEGNGSVMDGNDDVTDGNAPVMNGNAKQAFGNGSVMQSDTDINTEARSDTQVIGERSAIKEKQDLRQKHLSSADADFATFCTAYPASRRITGKKGRTAFQSAVLGKNGTHFAMMLEALEQQKRSEQWQTTKLIPLMTTWLSQERWNQVLPEPAKFGTHPRTAGNQAALERFAKGGRS